MLGEALDLINRQKAEIERLRKYYFTHDYHECHNEAIKTFAERLKAVSSSSVAVSNGMEHYETKLYSIRAVSLDNLVKELTEENSNGE